MAAQEGYWHRMPDRSAGAGEYTDIFVPDGQRLEDQLGYLSTRVHNAIYELAHGMNVNDDSLVAAIPQYQTNERLDSRLWAQHSGDTVLVAPIDRRRSRAKDFLEVAVSQQAHMDLPDAGYLGRLATAAATIRR